MLNKILNYIDECKKEQKNFTIRMNGYKIYSPSIGYVVSITPIVFKEYRENDIIRYVINEKYIYINKRKCNIYVGGWFDTNNKFVMDISTVLLDKEDAILIAKYTNQKAIYDILNNKTIKI